MNRKNWAILAAVYLAAVVFVGGAKAQDADLATMLQAIEGTAPTDGSTVLPIGTFWSAQHAPGTVAAWPPLPGNILALPVWPLGDGQYLLDDTNVDYAALQAEYDADTPTPMVRLTMVSGSLESSYAYGNPVYLTNMAASMAGGGMVAAFTIAGGTNFVPYDILTATNLLDVIPSWNWIGIGYTSNRYTFTSQPGAMAFYTLAKPSKTMVVPWGQDIYGQCDIPLGVTNALQVTAGAEFSLALLSNGTVVGWGFNGAPEAELVPTNLPGVTMIASGWQHNVALLTNSTVRVWGDDLFGEINVPAGLTNVSVVSAQALHSLVLLTNGTVVAWGDGAEGDTNIPAGLTNVTAIAAGGEHNLAVSNGIVVAWGWNGSGQCNVPAGLSNVWDVAAGYQHSLALKKDGTVVAWGDNNYGETTVPANATNIVAIAAGGDPGRDSAYSMALRGDGTVITWGTAVDVAPVSGMNHVIAIAAGVNHGLAIRTGPPTPVITTEPTNQYQIAGGAVTFTSRGSGLYGVAYQWQTNGVNLPGATNAALVVTNVQAAQTNNVYDVVVTDNGGMGSLVSSNAAIYLVTAPVVNAETLPTNQFVISGASLILSASVSSVGQLAGFPLSYQWQFNGTNISGATASSYAFTAVNPGVYSLIISNAAGTTTIAWQVNVFPQFGVIGWGATSNGQLNASTQLTNVISLAASKAHGVAALDNGAVTNWGAYWTGTSFVAVSASPLLTNTVGVAAGSHHDLALKADGTLIAWGINDFGQTNVPPNATNVAAIAAGGQESLALLKNGTVLQWGQTYAAVPTGLTNVTAIAAGTNFNLALLKNSTVVAWGANDYGQTSIPVGLSNVVAIAAGGSHALALEQNGSVVAWGAWDTVPATLTNAMTIAAGENHSIAIKNDGTVVCWGDDTYGQTNGVIGLSNAKLIAGGGNFSLATEFSETVSYPINVTQDLLLVYNTNSANSAFVLNYYLAHRPMVSAAHVLGIGWSGIYIASAATTGNYTGMTNAYDYETVSPPAFTNQVLNPVLSWLAANPTLRPQYVVMMFDVPSRINTNAAATNAAAYPFYYSLPSNPSVSYQLATSVSTWQPFITHINMLTTNDCIAYINKLQSFGSNSPGNLIISASASGYGNTNYVLDGIRHGAGYFGFENYSGAGAVVSNSISSLVARGVSTNAIVFADGTETIVTNLTSTNYYNLPHPTGISNIAGYICWGAHSSLAGGYAVDGVVDWIGNSDWYVMATLESYNGQRFQIGQGNLMQWFSSGAFGGINYSHTPVAAVSNVDEPNLASPQFGMAYFGLWAGGKNFGICAWNAINSPEFQAVGDPFIVR